MTGRPAHDVAAAEDPMRVIVSTIEQRFATHGATPEGLYWPNGPDLAVRYGVFHEAIARAPGVPRTSLLDFGCGLGFLPDWLAVNGSLPGIDYTGLDVSPKILAEARQRHPRLRFVEADVLSDGVPAPPTGGRYDHVFACGIFTAKFLSSHAAMEAYVQDTLRALWASTERCLTFNAMTVHVDYTRDDLFHWPVDAALAFCKQHLSRHCAVRADYGLWEYTMHVWRTPNRGSACASPAWSVPGSA
jgi:SAM-dependent methyltransferase